MAGSALVQPVIMPFVNFQTYLFLNPTQTFKTSLELFFKQYDTFEKLSKGALGRGVHRSATYLLGFLLIELMKGFKETPVKENGADHEHAAVCKR